MNVGFKFDGGNVTLSEYFPKFAERYKKFEVRDTDVFLAAFPKTGTTWVQEMVWLLGNDLDYDAASNTEINIRFPFFDEITFYDPDNMPPLLQRRLQNNTLFTIEAVDKIEGKRFIKTHVPYFVLPEQIQTGAKKPKIISVVRNPKDTCVSYYHFLKNFTNYTKDFSGFADDFLNARVKFSPYWTTILSYWERREQENMLVIKYEDMKKDLSAVVQQVATFLGTTITKEDLQKMVVHLSFDSMKNNKSVNKQELSEELLKSKVITEKGEFIRSGGSRGNTEIPPEIANEIEALTKKHFSGTGLNY